MSEYKSNGRVAIETVVKGLEASRYSIRNQADSFSQGVYEGMTIAIKRLMRALNELKEGDEDTEARVLQNYFYGDSCGAFDN